MSQQALHTSPAPTQQSPPSRWLLPLIALAQLMLILDVTVTNVALPQLSAELRLGPALTPWVVTGYVLMIGGFMLVGGRASDAFGSRQMLLVGLGTFTAASLGAALAQDGTVLVVARAIQGLGAALVSPAALSTLTTSFTGAARHRALGVWAAVGGAGASVGVILGGLLTDGPGWRWIFLVNIPVGLVVMIATLRLVRDRPTTPAGDRRRRLDLVGGLLGTTATATLIYGLTRIGQDRGLTLVSGLVVVAAIALVGTFLLHQAAAAHPLIDPRILATPRVATGATIMLTASAILVGLFFLLSFSFQRDLGWSPLKTGLAFLPLALGATVGAHLGSRLVGQLGPRHLAPLAFGVTAGGLALAAWQVASTWVLLTALGFVAAGLGCGFVLATTTALGDVAHGGAGVVSGIVNTFHELGSALGVAALSGVVAATGVTGLTDARVGMAAMAVAAVLVAGVSAVAMPRGRPAAGAVGHLH